MIIGIILLVAGFILVVVASPNTDDDFVKFAIALLIWFLAAWGASILSRIDQEEASYKEGQVDALNGDYKYEKRYIYRENDSIPIDSVYVLIDIEEE
jgi:hypothetical protein